MLVAWLAIDWSSWTQPWALFALVAVTAVGAVCSLLSVFVVVKRMAFIGQGVSHAGFGGYSLALLLGAGWRANSGWGDWRGWAMEAIVLGFCVLTAIGIGLITRRRRVEADAAIGIVLVAGMAAGVLLQNLRIMLADQAWYIEAVGPVVAGVSWEHLLFGSPFTVGARGMWLAVGLCAAVVLVGVLLFKELLFFAFDQTVSRVHGVPTTLMHYLLLVLLALVVVVGMRLVGFILISALLVLPGAGAMQLSRRLGPVLGWSLAIGVAGSVGGLLLALEAGELSPGACIVLVMLGLFAAATVFGQLRSHATH